MFATAPTCKRTRKPAALLSFGVALALIASGCQSAVNQQNTDMAKYVDPLHQVILTRLFQQLSQVYDTVKLDHVISLVSPFQAPYNYTAASLEKFVLNASKKGELSIRVDHVSQSITFQEDVFSSAGTVGDVANLQATPSELMRTQLSRLAYCLHDTVAVIDKDLIERATVVKRAAFARAIEQADEEHKRTIARREVIARRKELSEELRMRKEIQDSLAAAAAFKLRTEQEAQRVEDETKKRKEDAIRREIESVRISEAKALAASLKNNGGLQINVDVSFFLVHFRLCASLTVPFIYLGR